MNDRHFNWAVWVIWISIGIAVLLAIFWTGCSSLTVAPKDTMARAIAFDKNTQNAGLIDCDANGCIVTKGWMAKYKELEGKQTIGADAYIKPEGANYRVSYEVTNNFVAMQRVKRSSP